MRRFFVLGLLTLASMGACSNKAAVGAANLPCDPPPGVQDAIIYPAPGSTGIPDNISAVIFAGSTLFGLYQYNAHLIDETSSGLLHVDFEPFLEFSGLIPQPAVTPPFSNPTYEISINGGIGTGASFPPGHQITVQLGHGRCAPVTYGSFTVQ